MKSKKKRFYKSYSIFSLGLVVMLLSMLSTSCQTEETSGISEEVLNISKESTPSYTFGIIYPMAHPYYETITQVAKESALPYNVQLMVKAPEEASIEQQIRMMETMIAQNVDGIAVNPLDSDAIIPVINKAVHSGIPVICFESDSPYSERHAYIGTDNFTAGVRMGQMLDRLLNGEGMVIVESGLKNMRSLEERLSGFLDYIKEKTSIQVLDVVHNDGSDTLALTKLETLIDNHPHFDAFIALDYVSTSASVLVWKSQGLSRYALAFGMMPETKDAIRNGQVTAALSQNEQLWGKLIIERLYEAANGHIIPHFEDMGTTEITTVSDE